MHYQQHNMGIEKNIYKMYCSSSLYLRHQKSFLYGDIIINNLDKLKIYIKFNFPHHLSVFL
jgi:hypothetical protein